MAAYTLNKELNGIEISFNSKPDSATLDSLKASGFRWHRVKKVWYAKQTEERLTLAAKITGKPEPEKVEIKAEQSGAEQAGLKALYKEIITDYWKDDKMIDFCMKKAAYIVPLENGDITEIEKPSIETHFCFGYGMNGISTEEDYQDAQSMMHHADTNEQYFIDENMKGINSYIENLKDKHIKVYKYVHYCGKCDIRLKGINFYRHFEIPESNLKDCKELTAGEREEMIKGYEIVKKQFEKRLHTYLKRYGLSKLHTWTYLVD